MQPIVAFGMPALLAILMGKQGQARREHSHLFMLRLVLRLVWEADAFDGRNDSG
jgi:hypothetical protein